MSDYPKNGKWFKLKQYSGVFKWQNYKRSYQEQTGLKGRFMVQEWKGDFFKWKVAHEMPQGKEWEYV